MVTGRARFPPQMASMSHQSSGQPTSNTCVHLVTTTKQICMEKWHISNERKRTLLQDGNLPVGNVNCFFPLASPHSVFKTPNVTSPGTIQPKVSCIAPMFQAQSSVTSPITQTGGGLDLSKSPDLSVTATRTPLKVHSTSISISAESSPAMGKHSWVPHSSTAPHPDLL